jgi:hypothetical protein
MVETTGDRMMPMRTTDKPFKITKKQVYEAYKAVKSNQGAAGVDKESIEQFEANLKGNLYKLWNRMSSGSYFPPPVRAVSIPKKSGGERILGVPTVADRVAQTVVKQLIEPDLDPIFLADSYGYRPGKSALDAIGVTRERCWKYNWVLEFECSEASCHSYGCKSRQQRSPVAVVVISGGGKGDRPVGSPDVKVPDGWSDLVRSVQGGEQTDRP